MLLTNFGFKFTEYSIYESGVDIVVFENIASLIKKWKGRERGDGGGGQFGLRISVKGTRHASNK